MSYDEFPDDEDDLLEEIDIQEQEVRIITSHRRYTLNVRGVDKEKIEEAKKILKRMNFNARFKLQGI